ncbi:hypothetical protein N7532_011502 [Penicillium argentinense]|uniref:Uncharacterized protein n=1 Tax=Penicillium argentinense TaxID=1131581 RepID=A0A9W9EIN0_9EURO|nr:uncharacterized protein N7532_011502 [Penicillium argentinense]KAJ5082459.1 hypothetical protein N7532_011502 [Penicillium argentinense]
MITAGQVYASRLLPTVSSWTFYTNAVLFSAVVTSIFILLLAVHHLRRHCKSPAVATEQTDQWSQLSNMEKSKSADNSTSPPATSACDVLKPLSQNGNFPSSGAVAARAREQMQNGGKSSPSGSPAAATQPRSETAGDSTGPVQKRSESVQQMREVDVNGVRTWRRLVVEYS